MAHSPLAIRHYRPPYDKTQILKKERNILNHNAFKGKVQKLNVTANEACFASREGRIHK